MAENENAESNSDVQWCVWPYSELGLDDLYDLLGARQQVFAVEQNCNYLDIDGYDRDAWHVLGKSQEQLAAYARVLSPGSKYAEPSIGRVITTSPFRGQGIGRELMAVSIDFCHMQFPQMPIRIGAQRYLEKFYSDFGFRCDGQPYDEDGIPHIEMVRAASVDST